MIGAVAHAVTTEVSAPGAPTVPPLMGEQSRGLLCTVSNAHTDMSSPLKNQGLEAVNRDGRVDQKSDLQQNRFR
jgi:hypothetical protein